jgi:hypothetical protein
MANVLADPLPEGVYSPDLAAIVRYSRASTLMQPIDAATWRGLTDHFDVKQIIDIVFVVGMDQIISRFHAAILTEVDDDTLEQVAASCPVPFPRVPVDAGE